VKKVGREEKKGPEKKMMRKTVKHIEPQMQIKKEKGVVKGWQEKGREEERRSEGDKEGAWNLKKVEKSPKKEGSKKSKNRLKISVREGGARDWKRGCFMEFLGTKEINTRPRPRKVGKGGGEGERKKSHKNRPVNKTQRCEEGETGKKTSGGVDKNGG